MSLELVQAPAARWVEIAGPAAAFAERIAGTEFVPKALRDNAPAVAACIMFGDEIGVGPMTALQGVHVIDGRPFLSAELMRALVLSAGHMIQVEESSGVRCTVVGYRREAPTVPIRVDWTIEMARAAGLAGRGAWRSYPRALLLARASADLCRMAFPDIVRGLGHIPEAPAATDVADWQDYAQSLGPEPDAPALPATETVRWVPNTSGEASGVPTVDASPDPSRVPWDDDDDKTPAAPAATEWPIPAPIPDDPEPDDEP